MYHVHYLVQSTLFIRGGFGIRNRLMYRLILQESLHSGTVNSSKHKYVFVADQVFFPERVQIYLSYSCPFFHTRPPEYSIPCLRDSSDKCSIQGVKICNVKFSFVLVYSLQFCPRLLGYHVQCVMRKTGYSRVSVSPKCEF